MKPNEFEKGAAVDVLYDDRWYNGVVVEPYDCTVRLREGSFVNAKEMQCREAQVRVWLCAGCHAKWPGHLERDKAHGCEQPGAHPVQYTLQGTWVV